MSDYDAIIVGGGISGLVCARELQRAGFSCQILEASDEVGGRVRTDHVDGFLLDRGFQVFLTAYPEAQNQLDYAQLNLRRFQPGALIRFQGRFHRLADPWRSPRHILATALSPVGTLRDKLRIAQFRKHAASGEIADIYQRPEQTTMVRLREMGFSETVIERFFRPFLGGVFLDEQLQTSSRMCEFVFRMFSLGDAALPQRGMGAIPSQLAAQLTPGLVRTNSPVDSVTGSNVTLANGERIEGRCVIVAADAPAASRLLGDSAAARGRSVTCLYFAADQPPLHEPTLVLNGSGEGPINNLCVPSQVSPNYAPPGKSLVSVTVLQRRADAGSLQSEVETQLKSWYGPVVDAWQHLKTYEIAYALPDQSPPTLQPVMKTTNIRGSLFVCGDHFDTASINGAMASGRRAALTAAAFLGGN